ncbi:4-alpha-glucanotransferase [bacterium]|nr:4-alpha-glucanotransferase [bacterium]
MKISGLNTNCSFGRAFTTKELQEYKKAVEEGKKYLGTGKTVATVFDFSVPTSQKDTGIGTTFSDDAQKMVGFFQTMCGINAIQLQPQGEVSNFVRSPYSGTGFSLGMHTIDLTKLADEEYGSLLSEDDLNSPYMTRVQNHDSVDYDNVFSEDGQKAMLKKAYAAFTKSDKTSPLRKEFETFKKENAFWVEKDALYEAMAVKNGTYDMKQWSYADQNVFATKEGDKKIISELKKVKDNDGNNVVEFEEFVQFVADKQQKESKANFNQKGIDVYGDCQIGFSSKDFWAHKSAFYPDYQFGCSIGNDKYSCWSPAINFDKLDSDAGELLYNKFNLFFKRYNGVRIDAAWQLMKPLICEPQKENGKPVFDENGNQLGNKVANQPQIKDNGAYILNNIVLKAADDNKVPRDKVLLELLGGNSYDCLDEAKATGASLIHITRYGRNDWGRVKHYESKGNNRYQNMHPGQYIIGPGTHDDPSLIQQTEASKSRASYLCTDLYLPYDELSQDAEKLNEAVFAELFTTKDQFATLPDITGSKRTINTPNTTEGNWTYRLPQDYEEQYFTNLSQGKGLNLADALAKAVRAKNGGYSNPLVEKLKGFASILREDGPKTVKEADKVFNA